MKRTIFYNYYGFENKLMNEEEVKKAIFIVCPDGMPEKVVNQWGDEYTEYVDCDYASCVFEEDIKNNKEYYEAVAEHLLDNSYYVDDGFFIERGQGFEKWYNNR